MIYLLINYTERELDLVARLMRAEALGEGNLGMLMVGNVIVNRAIANCLTFKNIRTLEQVVYQNPGGFSGTNSSLFYSSSTTTEKLKENIFIRQLMPYGFMLLKLVLVVKILFMINRWQEDIRVTVFINQLVVNVKNSIKYPCYSNSNLIFLPCLFHNL